VAQPARRDGPARRRLPGEGGRPRARRGSQRRHRVHDAINPLLDERGAVVTDVAAASLDAYCGVYRSQTMAITISHRDDGDGLQVQLDQFPAMPIEHVDRGTFTLMGEPFAFFGFDGTGAPRYMRFRMRVQRRDA
jgi:hypothetical protein